MSDFHNLGSRDVNDPKPTEGVDEGAVELLEPEAAEMLGAANDNPPTTRRQGGSKLKLYVRRFLRNYTAVIGVVIFIVVVLFGLFGSFFTEHHYQDVDFFNLQSPPGKD